jgi:transcription initiation factor IIE alpha subunit
VDAGRYLAQRLDPNLLYCPNCEVDYTPETATPAEVSDIDFYCPRCTHMLWSVADFPRVPYSAKMKMTK